MNDNCTNNVWSITQLLLLKFNKMLDLYDKAKYALEPAHEATFHEHSYTLHGEFEQQAWFTLTPLERRRVIEIMRV